MDKDIANFAVNQALKQGATYAEARLEDIEANGFVLKNGIPELSGFERNSGIGIRLISNGVIGFISTDNLNKEHLKNLIKNSITSQKKTKRKDDLKFSEAKTIKDKDIIKQKIKLCDISPEEKLNYLQDIEKNIKSDIVPFRYFSLSDHCSKKYFINSEGTEITSEIPYISMHYIITIKEFNQIKQRYWQYGSSTGFEATKSWNISNDLLEQIKILHHNIKYGIKPPKSKIDLVVGHEVTGIVVHESCGHPYEADRVFGREAAQGGESFIKKEMIGQEISNPIVNIVDEPTIKKYPGYYKYDDEGIKAKRKYLIKEGKINELLHNRETSCKLNIKSNASARASSYNKEPIVRMSNTFMLPGKYKEDEIFEDVKLGVYIKNFGEWNIDDKRLNQRYVGNDAYLIKNGKIKEPVRSPILEISTFGFYRAIDAISNKIEMSAATCGKGEPMQGINVGLGGPLVRLRNIKLRGKSDESAQNKE